MRLNAGLYPIWGRNRRSYKWAPRAPMSHLCNTFTVASGIGLKVAVRQQIADDRRIGKRVVGSKVDILQHDGLGRGRRARAIGIDDDIGIVAVEAE